MSYPPLRDVIMTGDKVIYQDLIGYVMKVVSAAGGIYKNAIVEVEFENNIILQIPSKELTKAR